MFGHFQFSHTLFLWHYFLFFGSLGCVIASDISHILACRVLWAPLCVSDISVELLRRLIWCVVHISSIRLTPSLSSRRWPPFQKNGSFIQATRVMVRDELSIEERTWQTIHFTVEPVLFWVMMEFDFWSNPLLELPETPGFNAINGCR